MAVIFVKIDGVRGRGTGVHHGWLEAASAMMPLRSEPLVLTRAQDFVSHKLFKLAIDGTDIPSVTIDFVKDCRIVTRLELTGVLIEQFTPAGGDPPMEMLSLNYTAIKVVLGAALGSAALAGAASGAGAHMKL